MSEETLRIAGLVHKGLQRGGNDSHLKTLSELLETLCRVGVLTVDEAALKKHDGRLRQVCNAWQRDKLREKLRKYADECCEEADEFDFQ